MSTMKRILARWAMNTNVAQMVAASPQAPPKKRARKPNVQTLAHKGIKVKTTLSTFSVVRTVLFEALLKNPADEPKKALLGVIPSLDHPDEIDPSYSWNWKSRSTSIVLQPEHLETFKWALKRAIAHLHYIGSPQSTAIERRLALLEKLGPVDVLATVSLPAVPVG